MMKKITFLFFATLFCSPLVFAKVQYVPTQLKQFQTTGKCESCDLTNAGDDYYGGLVANSGVETPYDLKGSNLSSTTIGMRNDTLSNFSGVIAINTVFSGNGYSQADFTNATLLNANFQNANLIYADFTGANLTGVNFANADLYGAKGIDLSVVASVCGAVLPDGSKGACK